MKISFCICVTIYILFFYFDFLWTGEHKMSDPNIEDLKTKDTKLNEFYNNDNEMYDKNINEFKNLLKSVDNYVQRYISLFLITSNLRDYKVEDLNEEILIDLEISITGQDLAYLQGLSKNSKDPASMRDFSKLDAIFTKIARLKKRSYAEQSMRSFTRFISSIDYCSIVNNTSIQRLFCFLAILTALWTFRCYLFSKSFCLFVFIVINSNILLEGLLLYWRKLEQTDIKLYVETLQMKDIAAECETQNINWYNKLTNLFWKDKCIHYYETLAKISLEEVSLFRCILDVYSFYLIRTPIKLFGSSIRELTEEISGTLPWPISFLAHIPLGILFVIFGGFFILILFGKHLRLSFFGAALEIGSVKSQPKKEQLSITDEREKPIRKLKPWTKNRFPKNWYADCGKQWKLSFRSVEKPPDENVSNVDSSNEASISKAIKQD